ncbi:ABC transporter ATP-binding protein [Lipingzhangella sp. LS1_29]|uniref:ABC transporter ATP-binding protein n=1 Tax=Lipingzhangella rawalii TaxID=2055835 RepID=A0ABU2H9K9_9ACTN|nr:ABC transporter ATP-binding protein [Lipingzhangella rawalii]MDS1271539.1 ABC transporter ATP-binding protein [Lipingzhangella rawalii]
MTVQSPDTSRRALWSWISSYKWTFSGVLLLGLGAQTAGLAQPLATKAIFDSLATDASLFLPIAILLALAVFGLTFNYFGEYASGRLSERASRDLRSAVLRRILASRVGQIEGFPSGDLLSRTSSDMRLVQQTAIPALVDILVVPLTVLAGVTFMLIIDPVLALVVIVVLGVATVAQYLLFQQIATYTEVAQDHLGRATGVVNRVLLALRTVKSARTEGREAAEFDRHAGAAFRAGVRVARRQALTDTTTYAAVDLTFLIVLAVGALRLSTGAIGIGDLVAILLYVIIIQEPLESLVGSITELATGLAALRRVMVLLRLPSEEHPPAVVEHSRTANGLPPAAADGRAPPSAAVSLRREIEFSGVWLAHDERPVLRGLTMRARPGLTAVVGPSGAGKTSTLSLIQRFVDPDRGAIRLNGTDIHQMRLSELRKHISYVQQEAPLLGETIREAVCYSATDLDERRMWQVLEWVGLVEWVADQPAGLDTPVGEGGVRVSGGQRQRLAVARALLQDGAAILLDEATSQLDPPNEQRLVDSLVRHNRDRIIIAVTHRPSLAVQADQVIMLMDGVVCASGTHAEMLTNPAYRKLISNWNPQLDVS